jgi:hypothetical protein
MNIRETADVKPLRLVPLSVFLLSYPFDLKFIFSPCIEALSASLVGKSIFRALTDCMERVIRQANDKAQTGIPNICDLGRLPTCDEDISKAVLAVRSVQ